MWGWDIKTSDLLSISSLSLLALPPPSNIRKNVVCGECRVSCVPLFFSGKIELGTQKGTVNQLVASG